MLNMNVKTEITLLWRADMQHAPNANIIEQPFGYASFKARTDSSVEPQSILNKRFHNVYICPS